MIHMSKQTGTATLTEAIQRITNRNSCPYVLECRIEITHTYFSRVCNADGHVKCHHLAKKMGELKAPLVWLQRLAMNDNVIEK